MTQPKYDVLAIGNAIVDVISDADDAFIAAQALNKGGMTLIDADQAQALYDAMGPGREVSGGSAANTLAGLARLGHKTAFIGQVADDQLGEVFAHDIRATGIDFTVPARPGQPPRCAGASWADAGRWPWHPAICLTTADSSAIRCRSSTASSAIPASAAARRRSSAMSRMAARASCSCRRVGGSRCATRYQPSCSLE